MDEYTLKTRNWLEERYRKHDAKGIYFAHQPIYGLGGGHSEDHPIMRYVNTYAIMSSLAHLKFDTLLDVGGSEGYKAALAANLFGIKAQSSDLSEEACKRAQEIFHIRSKQSDIHDLAFDDGEFDVVLCSETLEHTTNSTKALNELLRVASKAVIVTVPHDNPDTVKLNLEKRKPHGHIHSFNLDSFNYLKTKGLEVIARRISSPLLVIPTFLLEARNIVQHSGGPYKYYNASVPVLSKIFNKSIGRSGAIVMTYMDNAACEITKAYYTCLFVILKDKSSWSKQPRRKVLACDIVDFRVPYHYVSFS
jgi:SAM-dependent methyltransferase